jgi:hypothetical protein
MRFMHMFLIILSLDFAMVKDSDIHVNQYVCLTKRSTNVDTEFLCDSPSKWTMP